MLQILYRAKDLDPEARTHVVRGNHTQSALLAGLRKFVLYELQVLAFTRIGNGVPSSPLILERTKDDGTCGVVAHAGLTVPQVHFASPNNLDCGHFKSNFPTTFFFSVERNKTKLFFSHRAFIWPISAWSGFLQPDYEAMQNSNRNSATGSAGKRWAGL